MVEKSFCTLCLIHCRAPHKRRIGNLTQRIRPIIVYETIILLSRIITVYQSHFLRHLFKCTKVLHV